MKLVVFILPANLVTELPEFFIHKFIDLFVIADGLIAFHKQAAELGIAEDEEFGRLEVEPGVLGAGGVVDIEFIVQYAVLRWAHAHPDLTEWTDNARLLDRLAQHGLLPDRSAEQLWNAYQVFRNVVHRRSLQEQGSLVPIEQLAEECAMVRDIWQGFMVAGD